MIPDTSIVERRASARGHVRAGDLGSRRAFSSGEYYDPAWMGFGVLRVLNEDTLAPGGVMPAQRCANMDVLLYVLEGALAVEGAPDVSAAALEPGDACWIGTGHGLEFGLRNASASTTVRWLQAWIQPDRLNARPAAAVLGHDASRGRWRVLAAPEGAALPLRQQASVRALRFDAAADVVLDPSRRYWLQVARGGIEVEGRRLDAGDALGWAGTGGTQHIVARSDEAEFLLFELPA